MVPISTNSLAIFFVGFLFMSCDSPDPAPAEPAPEVEVPTRVEPSARVTLHEKEGLQLDSLMQFNVDGIKSEEQATWLTTVFNRQDFLRIEKFSYATGEIVIRYSSSHTDRDKMVRMIEVNGLKVKEALYLNPDPGRSG